MDFVNTISFILYELLNYLEYIYKNFSFSLLFLIIIFVFQKEFSSLLNRIRQINIENNAGTVSVLLAEIDWWKSEMESSENLQLRQTDGEDPRDQVHLGQGSSSMKSKEQADLNEYFELVNVPDKTFKELARNGHIKTIQHLYNAYEFLTKDYQKSNHEPTKIIKNIYEMVMKLNNKGGYLFDNELVYNYRSFIQLTYLELQKKCNKQ
ncbi:hypothetical protein [Staphylococcus warneri]|mgnify:CR=1 FL=1|uniref:hypothetical protein n=2 Tax=Staphylococcus warneri TaxID=1292 RepID=UPI0002EE5AFE|nr:hypothetical protein [Staphylococcus warneri]MCJ1804586.1 hypothetical protein [Staphylococcus warneri]